MSNFIRSAGSVFAVVALLGACRDAQTDKEVTTRSSTGDAAVSMSGDSADKRGMALVRVVNAVPNAPKLVVRADPLGTEQLPPHRAASARLTCAGHRAPPYTNPE